MDITFLHILIYFVIYSFLGWVLESVVRTIHERKLINTGFLIGPFCPIYGFGAIIMLLFLNELRNNIILLFFISVIVLTLWEYIVGVLLEKLFATKYWDYSDHKFNYKGRICLTNSIEWGILGVLFINYIQPFVLKILDHVDFMYLAIAASIIALILLIDAIISTIKVKNIKSTLEKVEGINEQIKQKLLELKDLKDKEKTSANDNIQNLINNLKTRRDKTMRRLYRRAYRLKKAFPAIDTKEFTEVLSSKIELKHKKTKKEKKGE